MKLSLFQMPAEKASVESNMGKVREAARTAADAGSHVLMLPEYFATGYDLHKLPELAAPVTKGIFPRLSDIARDNAIALIGSSPSKEQGKLYNTAFYISADGSLKSTYHKMHLFTVMHENDYFYAGSRPCLFDTPWGKAGLLCCFDLRFPELARRLILDGAEILFVPAFWPMPRLEHWRTLLRARAIENLAYVAGCNSASLRGGQKLGYSAVIGPKGEVLAEAGTDEVMLTADIDMDYVGVYRRKFPALQLRKHGEYGLF